MSVDKYEYSSENLTVSAISDIIDKKTINGITCVWRGRLIDSNRSINYSWQFDWDESISDIDRLTGHIQVRRTGMNPVETTRFDINLTEQNQIIEKMVANTNFYATPGVAVDYCLVPVYGMNHEICLEEMFKPSDKTDAILVVEGKKLHVNKAFLSFHSDYFTALFSSNYKEGQMTEIPIEDVSFEDFGRLLSVIYPINVFPTDKTVEKLLELADRFLIHAVTRHVEHHLLRFSSIQHEKMILMADKYKMKNLLRKSIKEIGSIEAGKKLKQSAEYKQLSNDTKAMILDELLD